MLIASRSLKLKTTAQVVDIGIRLFAPVQASDGSWLCRYEIDWPEGMLVMEVAGIDAMQAIVVALQMIGSEIYTSNYHKAGQLSWDSHTRGYGFPIASSLRDLMVGDDEKFL